MQEVLCLPLAFGQGVVFFFFFRKRFTLADLPADENVSSPLSSMRGVDSDSDCYSSDDDDPAQHPNTLQDQSCGVHGRLGRD